jgi:hypothetical protein
MWYNCDLDVLRIQYFFSVVPDVSASGQLNVFFLVFVVTIYLLFSCAYVFSCQWARYLGES